MLIATRLFTRCLDLASLVLLARLLSPADFGLVAIAMTLILIVEAVSELPVAQAIVRLPVLIPAHLETAFTISLSRGIAIALLLCGLAWPFAALYGDHRLVALISALGLAPACRGLLSPALALYARKLDFRRDAAIEIGGKLIALLVSVSVAWTTRSYWSIAFGTITGPLAAAALSYLVAPWRPRLTFSQWPVFSRFLRWSSGGQVINAFNWQADQLSLGHFVAPVEMGRFSMASNLAFLPFQVVIVQVMRPLMAALALLQGDRPRLAAAYSLGNTTLVTLCLPVMVGMSVLAGPMVALALGPRWHGAAVALHWLALGVIPAVFVAPVGPLAMALNRTDRAFRLSVAELLARLPLTLAAAAWAGVTGVLAARGIATLVTSLYAMLLVRQMIGLGIREQILGPWRAIAASLVMALATWPLAAVLMRPGETWRLAAGLIGAAGLGAAVYALTLVALWHLSGRPAGAEARGIGLLLRLAVRVRPPRRAAIMAGIAPVEQRPVELEA